MKAVDEGVAWRFGKNVRECRGDRTQEEIADLAGLSRSSLAHIENGARVARITTMLRLAAALDVPPAQLLEGMKWTEERSQGHFEIS